MIYFIVCGMPHVGKIVRLQQISVLTEAWSLSYSCATAKVLKADDGPGRVIYVWLDTSWSSAYYVSPKVCKDVYRVHMCMCRKSQYTLNRDLLYY